jgi:hypothetical protein
VRCGLSKPPSSCSRVGSQTMRRLRTSGHDQPRQDWHRCRNRPGRSAVVTASQIPVHNDTKGMGAQMPTEKYGVRSPFHAGGGGGGGGGSGAATQVFEGTSYTVPMPHSTALALPGDTSVRDASGARIAATTIVRWTTLPRILRPPYFPDLGVSHIIRLARNRFNGIDHRVEPGAARGSEAMPATSDVLLRRPLDH